MMKVAKTGSNLLGMLVIGMGSMGLAAAASAVDLGVGANVGVQTPHVDVQTQGNAGTSAGGARVEGTSDARVNTHENLNRNDQKLPDATRGRERAQERMNEVGEKEDGSH
jgi:glycine/D-amino acid oxidase-like deaminating enzyme